MSKHCANCGSEIRSDLITGDMVFDALNEHTWRLESGSLQSISVGGRPRSIETLDKSEKRPYAPYGEYAQGETWNRWVVFKLGDAGLFKLNGVEDSYGKNTWIGVQKVRATTKTVMVYE